jgi:hypothetical protein
MKIPIQTPSIVNRSLDSIVLNSAVGGGGEQTYAQLCCILCSHNDNYEELSQIWYSHIWSRVHRDSDPRKTELARTSSIYNLRQSWFTRESHPRMTVLTMTNNDCERQKRSIVREGGPHQQNQNSLTVIRIWSWVLDAAWHQNRQADWLSIVAWLRLCL